MKVKPFRGIRPPQALAKQVSSRPYDVLNSEEARKEAEGNPMSLYHIIKPEINFPQGTDEHDERVYAAAKEQFDLFRKNGWLVQDEQEQYYVYAQTMDGRTQYGLVVAAWVEEHKLNLVHVFTVDDLNHLHRGGRVSKAVAIIGTLVGIKPVLHVDDEGHLVSLDKVRGRKKSLIQLVDNMEKQMGSYADKNDVFFISHGDSLEDAEFVAEEVKKRFGIQECIINRVGPTIGAHSGPGTIALFFMGDER